MRFAPILAAIGAAIAIVVPAHGADLPGGFANLRAQDALVQRIGYRLATTNGPLCRDTAPETGLLLHDLANYGSADAAALRTGLGLAGPIGVEGIVPGSPADRSGIAIDDTLIAVGERPIADFPLDPGKSWERVIAVNGAIDDALRGAGRVALTLSRAGVQRAVDLSAIPGCATRFEVAPVGGKAAAEGSRVVIGPGFAGFGYPEDEFAAALAHELAHNILRHRALLDATGRSMARTRDTEREADRMMPWLLANAGYDPGAAIRFMQRFGPGHDGWIFRERTHDGWGDRAERIALEAELVALTRQVTGKADWRTRFAPELSRSAALPAAGEDAGR